MPSLPTVQWSLVAQMLLALTTDHEVHVRKAPRDLDHNIQTLYVADAPEVAHEGLGRHAKRLLRNAVVVWTHDAVVMRRLVLPIIMRGNRRAFPVKAPCEYAAEVIVCGMAGRRGRIY